MAQRIIVDIQKNEDIAEARRKGRELSKSLLFGTVNQARINTAISELSRNIILYAAHGRITIQRVLENNAVGIKVIAKDSGPGIKDIAKVMEDGYSTSGGLGVGLPGVRRLMDEFHIESSVGKGTEVTVIKWRGEFSI